MSKGAFSIIQNEDNKILLLLRKDVPFWDLPGGTIENKESPKECSVREVLEETGLLTCPKYLIGCYYQEFRNDYQYIYFSLIRGGQLIKSGEETKKVAYFNPKHLPLNLIPLRKIQINDYCMGKKNCTKKIKKAPTLYRLYKLFRH